MKRLLPLLLLLSGCYDLDALTSDAPNDQGVDAGDDGGSGGSDASSGPQLTLFAGALGGPGSANGAPSEARFDTPYGLVADGAGNLYAFDSGSHTIALVDGSGNVTRVAGSPYRSGYADGPPDTSLLATPRMGVLVDNVVYFTDQNGDRIRTLDPTSHAVGSSGQAQGAGLLGITTADGTTTYVTESNIGQLAAYDDASHFTSLATGLDAPSGIAYGTDTDNHALLLFADTNHFVLESYDLSVNLTQVASGTSGARCAMNGWCQPLGVFASPTAGTYYVTDYGAHTLNSVTLTSPTQSTMKIVAGEPGTSGSADGMVNVTFNQPAGITMLGGSTIIADSGNHALRMMTPDVGVATLAGIAEHDGDIDAVGGDARFDKPIGVVAGASVAYVADSQNYKIRRIDEMGRVSTIADLHQVTDCSGGEVATFPTAIAISADSTKLYVIDGYNIAIVEYDLTTETSTMLCGTNMVPLGNLGTSPGHNPFNPPKAITISGTDLYIADSANDAVKHIDLSVTPPTTFDTLNITATLPGGNGHLQDPEGLAVDATNGVLYVSSGINCVVAGFSLAGLAPTLVTGGQVGSADGISTSASFDYPTALAFDGKTLYVSDSNNSTIRAIDPTTSMVTTYAGVVNQLTNVPGPLRDSQGQLSARLNRAGGLAWFPGVGLLLTSTVEHSVLRIQ